MLCKIGDVEIWRILELSGPFKPAQDLFPTAGPEVAEIIETHAPGSIDAGSGTLILPVQGFLLKTPSHIILVDSCVGNHKTNPNTPDWHQRETNRFMAALTAAGVGPADVDYVLCTHLHTDHVGWNTRLEDGRWVPTFPNARYLMPSDDKAMHEAHPGPSYTESVLPVIEAGQAELVEAGHKLGDHVTLIPTAGHTPGHVSVLVQSGGRDAIITGDALHSTAQCWHPDWHFLYDQDPEAAVRSRKKLLERCAESRCLVFGSHFLLPSMGYVKEEKDAFSWEDR
jgi:glyoxylase-like metal-dependent hydrolase (beta-lactamase superfamily II)